MLIQTLNAEEAFEQHGYELEEGETLYCYSHGIKVYPEVMGETAYWEVEAVNSEFYSLKYNGISLAKAQETALRISNTARNVEEAYALLSCC